MENQTKSYRRESLLLGLGALITCNMAAAQQAYDVTICGSGDIVVLIDSKELQLFSLDGRGIAISNHENRFLHGATWQAASLGKVAAGSGSVVTYYKFMDADGDLILMEAIGGVRDSSTSFLLGTGKWGGIKGTGKTSVVAIGRPIVPETRQACRKLTGTFELAK